jgi:hypothetical protein
MAQIGTVRLETQNSGVVDVPVFEPGDSASGIYEYVRVETASGPGFIPVTAPADATYPYLRVQSANDGIVAVTDTAGSDIPDSGDLHAHYDWSDSSTTTSTVPDLTGNGYDLTGTFSSLNVTINGVQAGEFDGNDDSVDVDFTALPQPNTIFIVLQYDSTSIGSTSYIYDSNNTARHGMFLAGVESEFAIYSGTSLFDGGLDANPHIFGNLYHGTSSIIRRDGTQSGSGDAGANDLDGFTVGSVYTDNSYAPITVGEILIYPQDKTGIASDVESYLSSKWGIAV